jgi:hypothetical protein
LHRTAGRCRPPIYRLTEARRLSGQDRLRAKKRVSFRHARSADTGCARPSEGTSSTPCGAPSEDSSAHDAVKGMARLFWIMFRDAERWSVMAAVYRRARRRWIAFLRGS